MSETDTTTANATDSEVKPSVNNDNGTEQKNNGQKENAAKESRPEDAKNVYEFTVKDIDGKEVSLSKYKGHPLLIVNVASNCGFTKANYKELNELYEKYESKGLRIAAFPCNQFLNQESACDVDIKEFAKKNGVKFDMYAKINVNGAEAIPLYRWLRNKQKGILGTTSIKWNFTKFLIDKEGNAIKRFSPATSPLSFESDIVALVEWNMKTVFFIFHLSRLSTWFELYFFFIIFLHLLLFTQPNC